jgi:hypothetical protein
MEPGFGQNLEGFLIKGNLSLAPSANPSLQGDGSIEGSGTLFFDKIKEYNQDNGINIQDVTFKNGQLLIPYTIQSESLTSASVIIDGGISIKHTKNSTSITSGGGLTIAGGASFGKNVNIGGVLNVNNQKIINVETPSDGKDAVNKDYVDSVATKVSGNFTTGQIIIANSDGDSIRGYNFFNTDLSKVNLSIPFVISNTSNANGTSGALNISGGVNISKDLLVDGLINLNDNKLINLDYPTNNGDGANKKYVDDRIASITAGSVSGNFTQGQLIVGDSGGNIKGYPNLTYDGLSLILNSTVSNSFVCYGGVSISKDVFIGGQLNLNDNRITNVEYPIESFDAVNKAYVDGLFNNIDNTCCDSGGGGGGSDNVYEKTIVLDNNITTPLNIIDFTFDSTIKAFIANIYINETGINNQNSFYTIYGINQGTHWSINTTYVGQKTNVKFYITTDVNFNGLMQYTNANLTGVTSITYSTINQINNIAGSNQINLTLSNNVTNYIDVPSLTFLNSNLNANKILIYISNDTDTKYSLFFINCLLKGDEWTMESYFTGDATGIHFRMFSQSNIGKLQYINNNTNGTYNIRVQQFKIYQTQNIITLLKNTFAPQNIDSNFVFDNITKNFKLTLYVEITELSKYALYEIQGFLENGNWKINSRFIGDTTGIKFYINTVSNLGYLTYTNSNIYDAKIKFVKNIPLIFEPLSVSKGGTGNTELTQYAVLRGNGTDPIIGTSDFIYKDYQVILGTSSSILLNNTQPAVSLSSDSGTFITNGGAVIKKNLIIGDQLIVKNVDITPSVGDITSERVFNAFNDISIPSNIDGYSFINVNIKSFFGLLCATITTDDDEYDTLYELRGLKKKSGWILNTSFIGDHTNIKLTITSNGQVQYTSPNIPNWISSVFKFKAMTTTYQLS